MDASETLRQFVYADVPLEQWRAANGSSGEPWASFDQARRLFRTGRSTDAATIWRRIATDRDGESRCRLQAWFFLRNAGEEIPAAEAGRVLGVIIETPVDEGHDLLAAYEDGSARYLNYAGKALVHEAQVPEVQAAIANWISVAGGLVKAIGVGENPELPLLPSGHLRVLVLTPAGRCFGQGPAAAIYGDGLGRGFIDAATVTFQAVLRQAGAH